MCAAREPKSGMAVRDPMPRLRNIIIAAARLCVSANPKAAAMKGAVQGAATATAKTPVKNAPREPLRFARLSPSAFARLSPSAIEPTSKTPERLRPTAKIKRANPATAIGFCNWKPHPTAAPPCLRSTIMRPNAKKLRMTLPRNSGHLW